MKKKFSILIRNTNLYGYCSIYIRNTYCCLWKDSILHGKPAIAHLTSYYRLKCKTTSNPASNRLDIDFSRLNWTTTFSLLDIDLPSAQDSILHGKPAIAHLTPYSQLKWKTTSNRLDIDLSRLKWITTFSLLDIDLPSAQLDHDFLTARHRLTLGSSVSSSTSSYSLIFAAICHLRPFAICGHLLFAANCYLRPIAICGQLLFADICYLRTFAICGHLLFAVSHSYHGVRR